MHLIDFMFHLFSVRIFAMQEKGVFVYDFHLYSYPLDLIMFNILLFSPWFINENIFKFFIRIRNIFQLSVLNLTGNNASCA